MLRLDIMSTHPGNVAVSRLTRYHRHIVAPCGKDSVEVRAYEASSSTCKHKYISPATMDVNIL